MTTIDVIARDVITLNVVYMLESGDVNVFGGCIGDARVREVWYLRTLHTLVLHNAVQGTRATRAAIMASAPTDVMGFFFG
jgi:hypothetical protein